MTRTANTTTRQHYVQRAYLSAWSSNQTTSGKIWCHFKETLKIANPNLMGVGQERYFYEYKRLTELEKLMVGVLNKSKNKTIMESKPYHILQLNSCLWGLEDRIAGCQETDGAILAIRRELGEIVQTAFEDGGAEFLAALRNGDATFFLDEERRIHFCNYFMMQFIRTKRHRRSFEAGFTDISEHTSKLLNTAPAIKEVFRKEGIHLDLRKVETDLKDTHNNLDMGKLYPYTLATTAHELAYAFSISNKMKLELLSPPDGEYFITGDQPAFNLLHTSENNNPPSDMKVYYPVSPVQAVRLVKHVDWTTDRVSISSQELAALNQALFDYCDAQVYAASQAELKAFTKDKI
ncbi:MAG: DUF4238 domain-containing protein [Motiliproteus sp.]